MKTSFTDKGLTEYMEWLELDRKKLKNLEIISCKGHYGDK